MAIFDLNEPAISILESSGNLSNCLAIAVCDNSGNVSGSSYADVAADSIEVHAATVYTRKLFVFVQKEIIAGSWLCSIMSKTCDELCDVSFISEQKLVPGTIPEVVDEESTSENVEEELILYQKDMRRYKVFVLWFLISHVIVVYNKLDGSVVCCCQLFVRCGILCHHIFCVFKNCNVLKVPDQYILKRWTRDLIPPDLRRQKARYGQENEEIEKLAIEASSLVESCND
ncbi:FAR1 DNA binding domain, Zinc finger, SWIM-type, MULE transposase domain, FHY3/FAR1 family [Artemisia annua]|uniref:FAR1 DNA binding domain, Zinc finger, SWIM-type, MULE transposase domain, FHY3/FAR1 family n=1 Tax=Artemisia annua TaxID=35608 RepID=A0A2U1KYE7_ARTAN|nr:FAR1 DNA binding domain, Zinc finger, SWIM-type, MULE transposase domain, FHY3/FAR1 family [Artemisia annua]